MVVPRDNKVKTSGAMLESVIAQVSDNLELSSSMMALTMALVR